VDAPENQTFASPPTSFTSFHLRSLSPSRGIESAEWEETQKRLPEYFQRALYCAERFHEAWEAHLKEEATQADFMLSMMKHRACIPQRTGISAQSD